MATCNDFKDRKGCGREIILKKVTGSDGAERFESFTRLPCHDNEGQYLGKYLVPHYFVCPEQIEYAQSRLDKMDESFKEWKATKDAQKPAGGGGGGFRGKPTGNGGGYNRAPGKPGGGSFRRAEARTPGEEG